MSKEELKKLKKGFFLMFLSSVTIVGGLYVAMVLFCKLVVFYGKIKGVL